MGRGCVYVLLGPAIVLIASSAIEFNRPPPAILIIPAVVLVGILALYLLTLVRRRRMLESVVAKGGPDYESLALRLLGNYPLFIAEAAAEFARVEESAAVPLITFKLSEVTTVQRPGWQETASSLLQALAQIKDPRPLPLLRTMSRDKSTRSLPNLKEAIAALDSGEALLRPADVSTEANLLRAASTNNQDLDSTKLLRPASTNHTDSGETDVANLA